MVTTSVVLLFAHDVSRSAHGSTSLRRSENRTFGVLANTLLAQEATLDGRLSYLLTHGGTLSRSIYTARLHQLAQQLPLWSSEGSLLRRPSLAHNVNTVLAQLTEQRVDAYQVVFDTAARSLQLPWTTLNATGLSTVSALASLLTTDQVWALARRSLVGEPGRVRLAATYTSSGVVTLATELNALGGSPTLTLTRGIGIAAVAVTPAPLPGAAGSLLLPPVGLVHVGVSVLNAAFVNQPVTLTIRFTPIHSHGPSQVQRMTAVIGPQQAFAFVAKLLSTAAGERATLNISISGGIGRAQHVADSHVSRDNVALG